MRTKPNSSIAFAALILLASSITALPSWGAPTVKLAGSIREVAEPPVVGPPDLMRPFVQRRALTTSEANATLRFEINLKMRRLPELAARLAQGQRISAAEMAAKYDPRFADYQRVANWVSAQGLTIERRDVHHHMSLFVSGTVGLVSRALQADFARVHTLEGEYTSAVSAPAVPDSLSPLLVGINGLQPHIHAHKHSVQPQIAGEADDFPPAAIAKVYGASTLYSEGLTGAGQTIAIVIDTFPAQSDLTNFWTRYDIAQSINNITFVQAVPGTLASPSGEETLDTEWASGMAPGSKVRVYASYDLASNDLDEAFQQVCDDVIEHPEYAIHEMTMSFGEGEVDLSTGQVLADDQFYSELAAAGVSLFASSGDGASTPDANGGKSGALQVESPASDPNVTGVGGTSLDASFSGIYTSESGWTDGGGGVSVVFGRPAWQTGTTVPAGNFRLVPDVSSAADPNHGALYVIGGQSEIIGGTSWSSPTWAGFCALLNQARVQAGESPLGILGPRLYPLLGTSAYASCFRDITTGNNGYSAKAGYDEVTGLGTPLLAGLLPVLSPPETLPLGETITPGQTGTFTAAATGTVTAFQWQRMPFGSSSWTSLANTGSYAGTATGTLSVTGVNSTMSGDRFQCLVTLSGTVVTTATPSTLVVDEPLSVSFLAGEVGVAGDSSGSGASAQFHFPSGVAVDTSGNIYVTDYSNNQIRKVTAAGVVSTPYGNLSGSAGSHNGTGNSATFNAPNGIAIDSANNLYVTDTDLDSTETPVVGGGLLRKISTSTNVVTTLASGFYSPLAVAVDTTGILYVADSYNEQIDKVTATGSVTVLAGQNQVEGFADGTGTAALFSNPSGIAVDSSHNVWVADYNNAVIRKITPAGVVTTPYGQSGRFGHQDGIGTAALFDSPVGLVFDSAGNLYVTDSGIPAYDGATASGSNVIRKITPSGIVSTVAGNVDVAGSTNGIGAAAEFFSLQAVALNSSGTLYLADAFNQTIRAATPVNPITVTISATTPTADVFGPVAGEFTVSRTGSTTSSLPVTYTVGGTAVAGTDYTALTGTLTIPTGSITAVFDVNPLFNSAATANRTVVASLTSSSGLYSVGSPGSDTVTITEPTAYQSWKLSEFGSNAYVASIGGDLADPNGNGVPNLLEYAFNSNPLQTGTEPLPMQSIVDAGSNEYLAITYTQLNNDTSLTYTVQVSSDLVQWSSGSSYTTAVSSVVTGSTTQVTMRDNTALTAGAKRFIRVLVGEN